MGLSGLHVCLVAKLRRFYILEQAPTHSTVTLSSDSDSLPNASPSRDDKIDSQSPERYNNHGIASGETGAESPLQQISKAKAPKRGRTGDGTPTKKERNKKKKKGEEEEEQREGEIVFQICL